MGACLSTEQETPHGIECRKGRAEEADAGGATGARHLRGKSGASASCTSDGSCTSGGRVGRISLGRVSAPSARSQLHAAFLSGESPRGRRAPRPCARAT